MLADRYDGKSFAARLIAGPGAVAEALSAAGRFADTAGIGRDATEKLAIIVEEIVLNVVDHGEAPVGSAISLTLACDDDRVRLVVSDAGRPFDPRSSATPTTVPDRGGGAGLALVRAWSQVERYERRRGRNRLVLTLPIVDQALRRERAD